MGYPPMSKICGWLACCDGQVNHLRVPVASKKSTLAYANEQRPGRLYRVVFEQTLEKCSEPWILGAEIAPANGALCT